MLALRVIYGVPLWLSVGGLYAALLGFRPGAYIALAGFTFTFLVHLVIGVIEYRRVMSRPWPQVAPIVEDEEDW